VPHTLRIAYTRGVTPGKWARIWETRFRTVPLELTMTTAVTDAAAELATVRDGVAQLAFIRLASGEAQPEGFHLIALYEERPFVVAPKDHAIEAADAVSLAELEPELRHPFDDDIDATIEVVAANVGVVVVPQSIARLYARKDVVARPVDDAPAWRVGLAWPVDAPADVQARIDEFIGVVRGRTANSSRGAAPSSAQNGVGKPERTAKPGKSGKTAKPGRADGTGAAARASATPAASGGDRRPKRPARGRPSQAGRSRRRPTR
jgi:DNA-binding transcriptional LysR family regulator